MDAQGFYDPLGVGYDLMVLRKQLMEREVAFLAVTLKKRNGAWTQSALSTPLRASGPRERAPRMRILRVRARAATTCHRSRSLRTCSLPQNVEPSADRRQGWPSLDPVFSKNLSCLSYIPHVQNRLFID